MTLNGVMAVIVRYFSEVGFPGLLRKSLRSLSSPDEFLLFFGPDNIFGTGEAMHFKFGMQTDVVSTAYTR